MAISPLYTLIDTARNTITVTFDHLTVFGQMNSSGGGQIFLPMVNSH